MRHAIALSACPAALLLALAAAPAAPRARADVPWLADVDEAFELAERDGRPLLVVFR